MHAQRWSARHALHLAGVPEGHTSYHGDNPHEGERMGSPLSVEGVFQMAYIVPERLLALVRPAFDLVLRRIRSLKRCVEA